MLKKKVISEFHRFAKLVESGDHLEAKISNATGIVKFQFSKGKWKT